MKIRPLVIDEKVKDRARQLMQYAIDHPMSHEELKDRAQNPGKYKPPGDDPNHFMLIDLGYTVVFTIGREKAGPFKQLSVSIIDKDTKLVPHVAAVNAIAELFNFPPIPNPSVHAWLEDRGPSLPKAVNLVMAQDARPIEDFLRACQNEENSDADPRPSSGGVV